MRGANPQHHVEDDLELLHAGRDLGQILRIEIRAGVRHEDNVLGTLVLPLQHVERHHNCIHNCKRMSSETLAGARTARAGASRHDAVAHKAQQIHARLRGGQRRAARRRQTGCSVKAVLMLR